MCLWTKFQPSACHFTQKSDFVSIRHSQLRNIKASLLNKICEDVKLEPTLQLHGE